MRLRRPCIHDRYEEHPLYEPLVAGRFIEAGACPGGEFLPEDAIVLVKVDDRELWRGVKSFIEKWYDAADQVGEPG